MFGSATDNPNYILTQITPFNFGYFSLFLLVTFGAAIFYIFSTILYQWWSPFKIPIPTHQNPIIPHLSVWSISSEVGLALPDE